MGQEIRKGDPIPTRTIEIGQNFNLPILNKTPWGYDQENAYILGNVGEVSFELIQTSIEVTKDGNTFNGKPTTIDTSKPKKYLLKNIEIPYELCIAVDYFDPNSFDPNLICVFECNGITLISTNSARNEENEYSMFNKWNDKDKPHQNLALLLPLDEHPELKTQIQLKFERNK